MKLIGTLAMIDDGETDWKMIVIDIKDPIADKVGGNKCKKQNGRG